MEAFLTNTTARAALLNWANASRVGNTADVQAALAKMDAAIQAQIAAYIAAP